MKNSVVALAIFCASLGSHALAQCPSSTAAAAPESPATTNLPENTPVSFKWTAATATGITGYEVLLASTTTTIACTTDPASTGCVGPVLAPGSYTWLVRTKTTACASGFNSESKQFQVGCPSAIPVLQTPQPGSQSVVTNPTYSWTAVPGADRYDLYLGPVGAGCVGSPVATASTNSFNLPALQPGTSYEWRVAAKRSGTSCPAAVSTCSTFRTAGAACAAPGGFSATAPASGAVTGTNPTLKWTASAGAFKYQIHLGTANPPQAGATDPLVDATGTSYTPTALPPGTYFWSVDAFPSCSSTLRTSSNVSSFVVQSNCPTASATPLSPKAGDRLDSTRPIAFTWSATPNADSYELILSSDGTTFASVARIAGTATSFTINSLAAGNYIWLVRTNFTGGCPSTLSAKSSFAAAVPAVACPTAAPSLDAPANNATGVSSPVLFDWKPVTGATSYRLVAMLNGGSPVTLAVLADTEYLSIVPAGSVEWWVEALADSCPAVGSSHLKFTAVDTPSTCLLVGVVVDLLAPADNATGLASPVTFRWTGGSVNGLGDYRVWGIANGTAPFLIGSASSTQLTGSVPQGTLTWYVEARINGGLCPSFYSKRQTFTVATGSACNGTATTLVSPVNKATAVASPVPFRWTAVPGAIGYKLFIGSGTSSGDLAGFTTETTLSRLVPDGSVNWWVDTMFIGCPEVQSSIFQFTAGTPSTCGGGSIALTRPASGASVTSPVSLAWTAVTAATSYRVWMSFDGQPAEVVARSADTTASVVLPSATIDWYVEAQFSNCPSLFSPHSRFTVSKGAGCDLHKPATLVSPTNGDKRDSPVDFQWTAADPAALYRVWFSADGTAFTPVGITKTTHLQSDLPPGDARWYVESFFEGCPSVASPASRFTVAKPACGVDAPAPIAPSPGTASVSAPVAFVWSAVPGAVEYRLLASLDGEDLAVIDKTMGTSSTRPLPPGVYVWQVVAVFDGCPATKSAKSRFTVPRSATCSGEVPQLIVPLDGAGSVTSPVTLNWNPITGAVAYVVFVRHADGAPTRLAETLETQVSRHLPEGRIEWWVVAISQACPPAESRHFTFTIPVQNACDHPGPLLLGPAQGATALVSPVVFSWTAVPKATSYKVWAGVDGQDPSVIGIGTTAQPRLTASLPAGIVRWYVEASFDSCPAVQSSVDSFAVLKSPPACATPARPQVTAPGQVASNTPYTVRWGAIANASSYEVEESATADFSASTTLITSDLAATFTHAGTGSHQRWRYRVRAISNCSDDRSRRSATVSVVVLPEKPQESTSIETGAQPGVSQTIFIAGQNPAVGFTAKTDQPWATVSPSSGTLGPAGVTLTVTTDATALKLGSNKASVILTYPAANPAAKVGTRGVTPVTTVPVSISLVTPVSSGGKTSPPPDSLIIPVVGHLSGANGSQFQSDVRVANTSAQPAKYQLNLTLTGTDGTQSGQSTTIQVAPGATMALDDVLANFFGIGAEGAGGAGMLEIRPLTSSATTPTSSGPVSIQTVASSRTYTTSAQGTFGQYIPAISLSQFIEKSSDTSLSGVLTLQHLAQSSAYRTNLGLVEGAGEAANVLIHVFNDAGAELVSVPLSLMPGEHKQLNYFLAQYGIAASDARIEVEMTSSTGKVSAYASVVDNLTNDPLLVPAVVKAATTATQYVVPAVADAADGTSRSRSDLRIYNSGSAPVNATLVFTPENNGGAPVTATLPAIAGGEVRALDDLVNSLFGKSNLRGSISITTATASTLVVTSRTYTQTGSGTYGQFVPAVSAKDSTGAGERILQLVQLEQSARYNSDIGVVETSGKTATVEVSVITPDSKVSRTTSFTLAPNGTQRLALADFGLTSAYNARVTVKVLSGSGRVSAYGSVVDLQTHDATFIPAQ